MTSQPFVPDASVAAIRPIPALTHPVNREPRCVWRPGRIRYRGLNCLGRLGLAMTTEKEREK